MASKASSQVTVIDVTDAYSVLLTSESYTFIGNTTGAPSGLSCTTQVVAYCGAQQCSNVSVLTVTCPTGISATISNNNTVSPTVTFNTTTTITEACEATIPVVVDGVTINKKFSFAVAKQGTQGNTGATGKGISSVTPQYYISTSKTSTTGGSWSDTAPTTVAKGKYLWTRMKVTYTNPSSTEYTTAAYDSMTDSRIEQLKDSITLSVTDGSVGSTAKIKLGVDDETKEASIDLTGAVTFSDLSTAGSTTINGANITTGTFSANKITTGTLSTDRLDLTSLFAKDITATGKIQFNNGLYRLLIDQDAGVVKLESWSELYFTGNPVRIYNSSGGIYVSASGAINISSTAGVNTKVNITSSNGNINLSAPNGYLQVDTGKLIIKNGVINNGNDLTGIGGTSGYVRIMTIKIGGVYSNMPISFTVHQRGIIPYEIVIRFANSSGTDPSLEYFTVYKHYGNCYMVRTAAGTWDVYVQKSGSWDNIAISNLDYNIDYMSNMTIDIDGSTLVSSLPSGAIAASFWDITVRRVYQTQKSTLLWSGAVNSGSITLSESPSNFTILVFMMGNSSGTDWGWTTFTNAHYGQLRCGSIHEESDGGIITSMDGTVSGATLTISELGYRKLSYNSVGTFNTGVYITKVYGIS